MRSARAMATGQSQCAMCIGPGVAEFSLFVLLPSTSLSSPTLFYHPLFFIVNCIRIITLLAIPFYCLYSSRPYLLSSQIYST